MIKACFKDKLPESSNLLNNGIKTRVVMKAKYRQESIVNKERKSAGEYTYVAEKSKITRVTYIYWIIPWNRQNVMNLSLKQSVCI